MQLLGRSETVGVSSPKLQFFHVVGGVLVDPFVLEYQILDVIDDVKKLAPVQLFPVSGRQSIDLVAARVGAGRHAATWTTGALQAAGKHRVRWFWRSVSGGPEQTATEDFDVLAVVGQLAVPMPLYALPSDLRDEGVPVVSGASGVSDVRLIAAIHRASLMIERVTRRFFEPRFVTTRADGTGTRALNFGSPVIGVESIATADGADPVFLWSVDASGYRIYNRHLAGMAGPDDRTDPRIELYGEELLSASESALFHGGRLNVLVSGLFGYTDFDGSPAGHTPDLIRHATMLLAMNYTGKLTDGSRAGFGRGVKSETVRDQSVTYGDGGDDFASFTGDAEVDSILASYVRPPVVLSV